MKIKMIIFLILTTKEINSQTKVYTKFQIGAQVFNESILSNNGIMVEYDGMIYDDYIKFLEASNPDIINQSPRSFLGFNRNRVLGNINGRYNFDYYNSLTLFIQFSYRYNMLYFYEKNSAIGKDTDFGDLNFNIVYFRNIRLSKMLSLKLGLGAGLVFSDVSDLNDIYGYTRFSNSVYNNENAYFFKDNKRVVTTKNLFRNSVDINLTPRFELDFTKERKSYFSIIGGMNIMPFDYLGVETKIYDLSSGQVTNSLKTKFKNTTFFIGLGYTFGWKKREVITENQYFTE
jgi:opacity protein-like surface antigen